MYNSKCEYCGKEMTAKYKSQARRYCSHECANKASAPVRTKERTELKCDVCGKTFELLDSQINSRLKRGGALKYCSTECMGLAMRKRQTVKCKNCGIEFETTRNAFCSRECSYEYRKKTGVMKKDGFWYENGYRILYLDGDSSIKEHRKVMEDYLGRELTDDEVVHHINGIKDDNRIENLRVMSKGAHHRLHRKQEKAAGKHLFGGYNGN